MKKKYTMIHMMNEWKEKETQDKNYTNTNHPHEWIKETEMMRVRLQNRLKGIKWIVQWLEVKQTMSMNVNSIYKQEIT